MQLTKSERQILISILRLQQTLTPNKNLDVEIAALENGFTDFYPGSGTLTEELDPKVAKLVYDVLEMYLWIQAILREENGSIPPQAECPGFDGNSGGQFEGAYFFAKFLIDEAQRFSQVAFRHGGLNSHGDFFDYRKQVEFFKANSEVRNSPETDSYQLVALANSLCDTSNFPFS